MATPTRKSPRSVDKPGARKKSSAASPRAKAPASPRAKASASPLAKAPASPRAKAKAQPAKPRLRAAAVAAAVGERLAVAIPTPIVELDFQNAWQLVIATILAAQSTDKTINKITPALFARYPTPAALGAAPQEDVEALVKQSGFFRNKAKAIREASAMVAERFGGEVPRTIEELTLLPGVARKTANVVLGSAYGIASGVIVDTHAGRVSRRLRLTRHEDPVDVEQVLMKLFPREAWIEVGHRLVLHGRYVCVARAPRCADCPLAEVCASAEAVPSDPWTERAAAERGRVESRGTS